MSPSRLPSQGPGRPENSNFFWLSELTASQLFYNFIRPNSSKSSLPQSIFDKRTPDSSRPTSSRTMSSKAEAVVVPPISSPDPSLDDASAEKVETSEEQWKPGKKEWAVMMTFVISNMFVALDASILVSVLPVSIYSAFDVCSNIIRHLLPRSTAQLQTPSGLVPHTYLYPRWCNPSLQLSQISLVVENF